MTSGRSPASLVSYGLIAACVWLGWQVVMAPLSVRAPPNLALRLSPSSPETLRRAAEAELEAGRTRNARDLAGESLARAPFNARALRVSGLAVAREGDRATANTILTLAGNWSLRDDPAHAWLVDQRLRQGNYASAFAHADTLARRRPDTRPAVFNLFTTAAAADPRALGAFAGLVGISPPWRAAYLDYAQKREDGDAVLLGLSIALARTEAPLTTAELEQLYLGWLRENRLSALKIARTRLGRPPLSEHLQDGSFGGDPALARPFAWSLETAPGFMVEIVPDDLAEANKALRVEYSGYGGGIVGTQLLMLATGDYELRGAQRVETGPDSTTLTWSVRCFESDQEVARWRTPRREAGDTAWRGFLTTIRIPKENCTAQWLRLAAEAGDERSNVVAWFDNLKVAPLGRRSR